jgi:diguanylate cyclase (GGDEF)-like protein
MATTVEGVETLEQLEIVRAEGCTSAQGYYFSRPLNVVALNQYIATNRRTLAASSGCDARHLAVTSEPVPTSEKEERRLQALYDLTILDTPAEDSFDRITRIAMAALHAPMAALSLIDRDRQWFKSRQGVDLVETPRNISFCTNTIEKDGPFIVPDTLNDPKFCANPLVVGYPHIRFYLGVPLRTAAGYNIGALCINDTAPRVVSQDEIDVLQDLARLAVDEMELRKLATVDSLTGLASASAFLAAAKTEFKSARQSGCALACIVVDIDHLDLINATYGRTAGDLVLAEISRDCRTAIRSTDILGRISGEEFAILLPKTSMRGANAIAYAIRKRFALMVVRYLDHEISVTASFGVAVAELSDRGFSSTLARATDAAREAKIGGPDAVATKNAAAPGSCLARLTRHSPV